VLLNLLATNYRPLLNGDAGLSLIPAPFQGEFNPQSSGYQWFFAAGAIVVCALVFLVVRRITASPYGRSLRAMRDNDVVADSLGKDLLSMRTAMLVTGGAIAGLSGGILVSYITTWSPAAWGYAETVVLFAAVIIGGAGNHAGAVLGAILVPVGFEEVTRYIPTSNNLPPNLIPSLEWVAIGLLIVIFLWVRPQGILPERKRVLPVTARSDGGGGAGLGPVAPAEVAQAEADLAGAAPAEAGPAEAGLAGVREAAGLAVTVPRPVAASPSASPSASRAGDGGVVLQVIDVTREFGGVHAVAGVSFAVRHGTMTGLIGPNGAGKSTLLAMLAGTLPVSSGQVRYLGQDVTGLPAFRRARLGLVRTFQLASEFKRLTVLENLLSAVPYRPGGRPPVPPDGLSDGKARVYRTGNRGDSLRGALAGPRYWRGDETAALERAGVLLEQFGLTGHANSYAGDLSGGQRRLVEIMRALMAQPKVLLLDEPMAGVHPNLARRIGNELTALVAGGLTVLMVEHELAIMDEFCDPVIAMAEGAVLAMGTMAELRGRAEVVEAYLVG
jgi:ABC-type branched-subunit amino acid transport system ATPase component